MVEVIVAFSVLVLILGIFSQAMSMTERMMMRADAEMESSRLAARGYYLSDTPTSETGVSLDFRLSADTGLQNTDFKISAVMREYKNGEKFIRDVIPKKGSE